MADGVELHFVTEDVKLGSTVQWADPVSSAKDMVDKAIAKLKPGQCIKRLVIAGHGAEGNYGFFCFDVSGAGADLIDGSYKDPLHLSADVGAQLARLRTHFCPDAVIEFRVCQFGGGRNGAKAMQAVADVTGAAVTAPLDPIKVIGLVGGLSVEWRTTYPGAPQSSFVSFWRAVSGARPALPPLIVPIRRGRMHIPASVAPATGQLVPLPGGPLPPKDPPAGTPPPNVVGPPGPGKAAAVAGAAAVVLVGGLLGGTIGGGTQAPAPQPAAGSAAPAPASGAAGAVAATTIPVAGTGGAARFSGTVTTNIAGRGDEPEMCFALSTDPALAGAPWVATATGTWTLSEPARKEGRMTADAKMATGWRVTAAGRGDIAIVVTHADGRTFQTSRQYSVGSGGRADLPPCTRT